MKITARTVTLKATSHMAARTVTRLAYPDGTYIDLPCVTVVKFGANLR